MTRGACFRQAPIPSSENFPTTFFAALHFLEKQDKAKVMAQPSIVTLNGNKASINVNETQYF